jgi:effector-binding domain-containing protein
MNRRRPAGHLGMDEPTIELRPSQPYLGIAGRVTDGVPALVDSIFPELFRWLGQHGIEPAGPPFIRFRKLDADGEPLELEVGAPVSGDETGDERVRADALPAGRYLTMMHVGPYRSKTVPDLAVARERLIDWAAQHGIVYSRETNHGVTLPCCLERYLIGPPAEADFSKWETEFAYLVLDD